MKSFPASFVAEKNKPTGSRPIWILKLALPDGSYVFISDRVIPYYTDPVLGNVGPTKAWVTAWGQIREGVTGQIGEYSVSEFSVELSNDLNDSNNIIHLIDNYILEKNRTELLVWFERMQPGITTPAQVMFTGYIKEIKPKQNDSGASLTLQDETLKLQNMIGNLVTLDEYPDADPDDVGKMLPIVYGTLEKFPALAVDAGKITSLPTGIDAASTNISVSDSRNFIVGMHIIVDDEVMVVSGVSGDVLTVTRGANATTPSSHQKGAAVCELKTEMIYVIADHPVTSITKIYGVVGQSIINIGPVCTAYPAGNHPNYPGKAVVSVPGFIMVTQAVYLDVLNTLSVGNGSLSASLIGAIARSGSAQLSGNLDPGTVQALLGNINAGAFPALTGNLDPGTIQTLIGNISPGTLSTLSGVIASSGSTVTNNPAHTHSTSTTATQAATNCPKSPPNGTYTPNGVYSSVTFPTVSGYRSLVTYSINIHKINIPSLNSNGLRIYVAGSLYVSDLAEILNVAQGGTVTYTFSVTGADAAADQVDVNVDQASISNDGIADWTVSSATRTIQYDAASGNSTPNVVITSEKSWNKGTLDVTGGSLPSKGTLDVSAGSAATNGTLGVTGGALPSNGTLALSSGAAAANGTLAVADTISVNKGTLGAQLTGNVAQTGSIQITGNSVANTVVGDMILVDLVGKAANDPKSVAQNLLSYANYTTPITLVGAYPSGYAINGAITEQVSVIQAVNRIAFETRSFFRFSAGRALLYVRPDSLTSVKTITRIMTNNFTREKSAWEDVINRIAGRFDRDYMQSSGSSPYKQAVTVADTVSQAAYGIQEKPNQFNFNFVTSRAMALSVINWYLYHYAARHWLYSVDLFLDNLELEFGDSPTLDVALNQVGLITETSLCIGNSTTADQIKTKIEI